MLTKVLVQYFCIKKTYFIYEQLERDRLAIILLYLASFSHCASFFASHLSHMFFHSVTSCSAFMALPEALKVPMRWWNSCHLMKATECCLKEESWY